MAARFKAKWACAVAAAVVAGMLAGCASVGPGARVVAPHLELRKGMAAADVVAELGEPAERRPADPPVEGAEVWVYRWSRADVVMEATDTVETPYFHPLTGPYTPVTEPVYCTRTSTVLEEMQLLVADEALVAWKTDRRARSSYQD